MVNRNYPPKRAGNKGNIQNLILQSFHERPKSRRMVAEELGMNSGTLCWHVDRLLKANRLFLVKKTNCEITGFPAVQYFTSNSAYGIKIPSWL